MNAESGPLAYADTSTLVVDQSAQCCRPRQKIHTLVYINLNQGNGGIVRDLSENGVAVQAVARLRQHQQVYLRFELLSPRTRVEAMGQVTWANASGQAGVQFTQISQRTRYLLKEWLWLNLLDTAGQLSSASPIFGDDRQNARDKLIVSGEPRPAIHLRSKEASSLPENEGATSVLLEFSWWPVPISAGTLSGLVDGLIISASVLLFSFVFLAISRTLPSSRCTSFCLLFIALLPQAHVWSGLPPSSRNVLRREKMKRRGSGETRWSLVTGGWSKRNEIQAEGKMGIGRAQ